MVDSENLFPLDSTVYEKLVAGINSEEEDVEVEHQYDYQLETGGEKEVDVMIWDRREAQEEKTIVECKFHNHNLNQGYVDEMVGLLCQSDADRAVLITKTGFQSGAIDRAEGLQDTDMRVDLFELRFYDKENDFENTINEINTRVDIFDWQVDVTSLATTSMTDEGEGRQFSIRFSEQDSPRLYSEDGQPMDETLFDRWEDDFHQKVAQEEEREFDSTYLLSFDDVYIQSPYGLFRVDEMEYKVQRNWHVAHEFTVGLETVFEQYDMVLIDALSRERGYIKAEDALQSFLSDIDLTLYSGDLAASISKSGVRLIRITRSFRRCTTADSSCSIKIDLATVLNQYSICSTLFLSYSGDLNRSNHFNICACTHELPSLDLASLVQQNIFGYEVLHKADSLCGGTALR